MRISDWSSDVCSSDLIGRRCGHRRHRAGRRRRGHAITVAAEQPPADRLRLSLCFRHADRGRGAGELVSVPADGRIGSMVATVPWLSIVTFTPLLGALAILVVPRGTEEEVARQSRWGALWVSFMTFLVSLVELGRATD